MLLNGKAKYYFEKWYTNTDSSITHHLQKELFYSKAYIERNAYYLEWFDSVGIYISIDVSFDKMLGYQRGFDVTIYQDGKKPISILYYNDVFEQRQKATEQAIIKANQIYNETI